MGKFRRGSLLGEVAHPPTPPTSSLPCPKCQVAGGGVGVFGFCEADRRHPASAMGPPPSPASGEGSLLCFGERRCLPLASARFCSLLPPPNPAPGSPGPLAFSAKNFCAPAHFGNARGGVMPRSVCAHAEMHARVRCALGPTFRFPHGGARPG